MRESRETQLRAFYSTTEEISLLFVKQQEQLKVMQRNNLLRTLEWTLISRFHVALLLTILLMQS
ncbi:hypothetical protein SAY86_011917 [Trapa natans]|uniref:Uncharacterized protein n=1 Tax=Trapa natans TaxID=22666 RepID=A0AAN7RCE4_TRANT|nr:hypothetical protein SAY86_011917 [Trapa natans]